MTEMNHCSLVKERETVEVKENFWVYYQDYVNLTVKNVQCTPILTIY